MSCEIKGIVQPYPQYETFTKKDGTTDYKQNILIETFGQYPKLVAITIMGGEKINDIMAKNPAGSSVNVFFDPQSREYQGKYYTNLTVWKVEPGAATAQAMPVQAAAAQQWTVGQIVNGHQLHGDGVWRPVQAAPVQAAPVQNTFPAPTAQQPFPNPIPASQQYAAPAPVQQAAPQYAAPAPGAPVAANPAQQGFFNPDPNDLPF